ncbi:MFS transporter [uncultured Microbulbifer sp.]|uniref:MFS transporter n=1 Tax=uncultured Microbulbifer sp. TaxID=348147 RepID=UPI0026276077|nr:MFS transporter [uncultured Microbulbifer sp.]
MSQHHQLHNDLPGLHRSSLRWLLVYTFFMVIGFSMVIPLVAVHFVSNLGMATAIVGIALAVRQVVQQGLTIVGGLLSDKFGIKPMICVGVLVRASGFAVLATATDPAGLILAMILSALGGALFEAPYQASIVALTTEKDRAHYYLLSNWVSGIATALGPLLGIALLQFNFEIVCYVAALCFLANSLIAAAFIPTCRPEANRNSSASNLALVFSDKRFVFFTTFMMGYWFTSVQFNLSFPLWAEKLSTHQESVGFMYTMSAAITVVAQYHLVKKLERKFSTLQIFLTGLLIMSLTCGAIGFTTSFPLFLGLVAIYTFGVLMTRPTQQTITANLANDKALGSYMGFSSLGLAVGGGLGSWLGGMLIDTARVYQLSALPWVTYCFIGLISTFLLFKLVGKNLTVNPPPGNTASA